MSFSKAPSALSRTYPLQLALIVRFCFTVFLPVYVFLFCLQCWPLNPNHTPKLSFLSSLLSSAVSPNLGVWHLCTQQIHHRHVSVCRGAMLAGCMTWGVHFSHSVRMVSARFLHGQVIIFPLIIKKYFVEKYPEMIQISCFSSQFHLLILASSIILSCNNYYCHLPNGDFLFASFLLHYSLWLNRKEELSLLPHLFIYSIIYWYHLGLRDIYCIRWLFYIMTIICCFAHIIPDFPINSFFKLAPESFPRASACQSVSTPLLSDTTRWCCLILNFLCITLSSAFFLKVIFL